MDRTEVKCQRCGSITSFALYAPLSEFSLRCLPEIDSPLINHEKQYKISDLLYVNKQLSFQVRELNARLEMYNEFLETIGNDLKGGDLITLYQMSKIVSRIEQLKNTTSD